MANDENLIPFNERTEKEQRKIAISGGKASGEARRAKKTMKEMLDYLLEKEITNKAGEKATTLEAISVSIIKQAMAGNTKAYEVIRDTIGQKPDNVMKLKGEIPVQKVFVTEKELKEVKEHIASVVKPRKKK